MPEKRRKFDREFREGAVRIVRETNLSLRLRRLARGISPGALGSGGKQDKIARGEAEGLTGDERAELARLRAENAELRMERDDAPMFVKSRWWLLWLVRGLG